MNFSKNRRSQSGQTLVESALVIIVLLFTLFGIIDFGQVLFFHQALVERARAGVRYSAVTYPFVASDIQNMTVYGNTAGTGNPILANLATSNVIAAQTGIQGCNGSRVSVTISNYPFDFSLFIIKNIANWQITESLPWEAPAASVCPDNEGW
jgi:Flp pilus assembly protein TadG